MSGKVGATLVVGGGIAGIQAALDLADAGFKVYMLDESPSIGGTMAQLDKTFPTNDCSMCILAPKLVGAGRHPNIELITNAKLEEVSGEAGNFKVKITKRPRYVKEDKCTGCGICAEHCPVEVPNEFNEKTEVLKLNVGSIILAPGFEEFDARLKSMYGYGRNPNVVSSIEFERI